MENIEATNNAIDNLIKDIDRLQVQNRAIKKAYRKLELAFEKKSQELKQLEKSDASKEQSSIEYYSLYRELKAENKALKERLEKAEAKLFMTVRNNIVGEAVGDTDVIALMIIRNFDEMIDFEKAIKSKAEAEARLKELKKGWDNGIL